MCFLDHVVVGVDGHGSIFYNYLILAGGGIR